MTILASIYQFMLIIITAPFAVGLIKLFKARLQGRKGASPLLPYFTILTLLKKEQVVSRSTSWVFQIAPFIVLGSNLFLIVTLPLIFKGSALEAYGHFIIVAGVLMLGTVFLVLGGLEAASAFGGMGASREMTIAALLEPTIILIFGGLALGTGNSEISAMLRELNIAANPFLVISLIALVLVALAENARYPVDNPATHLELTMVHEAMILEYSGPLLALMEYASYLKLTLFSVLLINLFFPFTLIDAGTNGLLTVEANVLNFLLAPLFLVTKIVIMMALLALLESTIVKMRFYRVDEFLSVAFFLALGGFMLTLFNNLV